MQATSAVSSVPSSAGGSLNIQKTIQPYTYNAPAPAQATADVSGSSSGSVSSGQPITYNFVKPLFPIFSVRKTFVPLSGTASATTTTDTASAGGAAVAGTPIGGGTFTWTKSYQPAVVSGSVTKTLTSSATSTTDE